MADIFLSYAKEDVEKAAALAESFDAEGWDVFWDIQLSAGESWPDRLHAEVVEAKCVVVLWSQRSVASHWVKEEARLGRDLNKLVTARIEEVAPPFGFTSLHVSDLASWKPGVGGGGYEQLVEGIGKLVQPRRPPEAGEPAGVRIRLSVKPERVAPGGVATWTVTVRNVGGESLRHLVVTRDDRPDGLLENPPFTLDPGRSRRFQFMTDHERPGRWTERVAVVGVTVAGESIEGADSAEVEVYVISPAKKQQDMAKRREEDEARRREEDEARRREEDEARRREEHGARRGRRRIVATVATASVIPVVALLAWFLPDLLGNSDDDPPLPDSTEAAATTTQTAATTTQTAATTTRPPFGNAVLSPSEVVPSSELPPFIAANLIDFDQTTYWNPASLGGVGAELVFRFGQPVQISEIVIHNLIDEERFRRHYRIQGLEISTNDLADAVLETLEDTSQPQSIRITSLATTELTMRVTSNYEAEAFNGKQPFEELAVEEVEFYGRITPGS